MQHIYFIRIDTHLSVQWSSWGGHAHSQLFAERFRHSGAHPGTDRIHGGTVPRLAPRAGVRPVDARKRGAGGSRTSGSKQDVGQASAPGLAGSGWFYPDDRDFLIYSGRLKNTTPTRQHRYD